jgi:hypothetical protein
MGFCAFCKVVVDPNIEQCPECGNRRFRFLTGRRQERGDSSAEPPSIRLKDLLIRMEDEIGRIPLAAEAERYVNAHYKPPTVSRTWMECIDTRTEETWWERFDEIEWRTRQLKDF